MTDFEACLSQLAPRHRQFKHNLKSYTLKDLFQFISSDIKSLKNWPEFVTVLQVKLKRNNTVVSLPPFTIYMYALLSFLHSNCRLKYFIIHLSNENQKLEIIFNMQLL